MAYIENLPITLKNPNGEELNLFQSGDEFSNYIHDEYDNKIMQGNDGYYYYAYQYEEEIFPSKIRVDKKKYKKKVWKKKIADTDEQYRRRVDRMTIPEEYLDADTKKKSNDINFAPDNTLNNSPENNSIHLGTLNNIVIFIKFADDDDWVRTFSYYDTLFNFELGNTVRNYFREVSYDKVDVVSHLFPRPNGNVILSYTDENPRNYYLPYSSTNTIGYASSERTQREHDLLTRAINAVKHEIPEDLIIDGNNDGRVDSVSFICRGNASGWGSILWGHRWALYSNTVTINNKRVWDFTFQPENQATYTILSHELFHVFGAPDLYRYYDRTINPVGSWDLMGSGNGHMGVYMKWKYSKQNWISDIPTITQPGRYTINSINGEQNNAYRINSSGSTNEYFIVEFRNKTLSSFDRSVPQTGLIVYRINNQRNGNANGPPDEVYVYRNNGTPTVNGLIYSSAYGQDLNKTEISNTTNPAIHFGDGSICDDVKITNIHIDLENNTASFDYNYDSNIVTDEYLVTLSSNPPDIGTLTGGGVYPKGTLININAES